MPKTIISIIFAFFFGFASKSLSAQGNGWIILDHANLASDSSRISHSLRRTGGAFEDSTALTGLLNLHVQGVRLRPLERISLNVRTGRTASMLQITLQTRPEDYGKRQIFHVKLNNRKALIASLSDPGGGIQQSFFIPISSEPTQLNVEVTADKFTNAPIIVSSVRTLTNTSVDFNKFVAERKMSISVLNGKTSAFSMDAESIRSAFQMVPKSRFVQGEAAIAYNYSSKTASETKKAIQGLGALAEETGIPLRIAFRMETGGEPIGVSDGAGGTFMDLSYQQITFDPANTIKNDDLNAMMGDRSNAGFGLTTPNSHGTPRLSYNHPRLNQLRRIRLTQSLYAWRDTREALAQRGKKGLLPGELSTGDASTYFAQGVDDSLYAALNGGKSRQHLSADFNPFVAADAQRGGIDLDPRNGLSLPERQWLHLNLGVQQQRVIDWMLGALPPDPITILKGLPHFERDLVRRNLFTEPYALPMFPMNEYSSTHPGIELSNVQDGKSGAEYQSGAVLPWLIKQREQGRLAAPYIEVHGSETAETVNALKCAFLSGARYATIVGLGQSKRLEAAIQQFVLSLELASGQSYPPLANVTTGTVPSAPRWAREYTANSSAIGVNRIEITPAIHTTEMTYQVTLRSLDNANPDYLTVIGKGERIDNGKLIFTLPEVFQQIPGRRYALSIVAEDGTSFSLERAADTYVSASLGLDLVLERCRSFAIEDRHDAEDLIASLTSVHLRTAQSTFAREALQNAVQYWTSGHVLEAYVAGIKAEQLSLPSAFQLPAGGGRMSPYWISAFTSGGTVKAVIKAYSDRAAEVTLVSETHQIVRLRWGNVETSVDCAPGISVDVSLIQKRQWIPTRVAPKPVRRIVHKKLPPVHVIGPQKPIIMGPRPPMR